MTGAFFVMPSSTPPVVLRMCCPPCFSDYCANWRVCLQTVLSSLPALQSAPLTILTTLVCVSDCKTRSPFRPLEVLSGNFSSVPCNLLPAESSLTHFTQPLGANSPDSTCEPRRRKLCRRETVMPKTTFSFWKTSLPPPEKAENRPLPSLPHSTSIALTSRFCLFLDFFSLWAGSVFRRPAVVLGFSLQAPSPSPSILPGSQCVRSFSSLFLEMLPPRPFEPCDQLKELSNAAAQLPIYSIESASFIFAPRDASYALFFVWVLGGWGVAGNDFPIRLFS